MYSTHAIQSNHIPFPIPDRLQDRVKRFLGSVNVVLQELPVGPPVSQLILPLGRLLVILDRHRIDVQLHKYIATQTCFDSTLPKDDPVVVSRVSIGDGMKRQQHAAIMPESASKAGFQVCRPAEAVNLNGG